MYSRKNKTGIEPKHPRSGQTSGWKELGDYFLSPQLYAFVKHGIEPSHSNTPPQTGMYPVYRGEHPSGFVRFGNYYIAPEAKELAEELGTEVTYTKTTVVRCPAR